MYNREMGYDELDDLGLRVIGSEIITNSGKSSVGSRVGIGSIVESKSKIEIHILFPLMECDFPKLMVQFQNLWV